MTISAIASLLALSGCESCNRSGAAGAASGPLTPGATIAIPSKTAAYVTNNGSDSLTVLDRDAERTIDVPVDLDPDAHEAPHHLVVAARERAVFVALAFPANPGKTKDPHRAHGTAGDIGKLARLDLDTLAARETVDVDESPGDVVLTHDRRRLLVTHFDMQRAMNVAARGAASPATMFAQLVVIDAATMKRTAQRAICTAPHGVVTTADDRTAYVACYGSDELAIVDLSESGLPTTRIPLGAAPGVPGVPRYGPYAATLSPDERLVVVTDLEGQDVRIFDRETKAFLGERTIVLAAKAFMPAFVDATNLIVPTQAPDGLVRVDVARGEVTARAALDRKDCLLPHVVRIAADRRAYLVCEGDHRAPGTVLEIDPTTLATKRKWTVGVYPDGIDFGE